LWVSYHVKLLKPRLPTDAGNGITSFHTVINTSTGAILFPVANPPPTYDTNNGAVTLVGANTVRLQKLGKALVQLNTTGATITGSATFAVGANVALVTILNNNTSYAATGFNSTTTSCTYAYVNITTNSNTTANDIVITGPTTLTAGNVDLIVSYLPSDIA